MLGVICVVAASPILCSLEKVNSDENSQRCVPVACVKDSE